MHGKGHERLPNGQSYMVYTNNGNRIDCLTEGKVRDGMSSGNTRATGNQNSDLAVSNSQDRYSGVNSADGNNRISKRFGMTSTNNSSSGYNQQFEDSEKYDIDSNGANNYY
jgi:hypothetical protein